MNPAFEVFDAHVHVGRWKTPDFVGRLTSLAETAAVLEGAGITGALVMPTDEGDNTGIHRAARMHNGSCKFFFAAWVDPRDETLPGFLKLYSSDIYALKVHTSFIRMAINASALTPYLDIAETMQWPVVVHCGRWREVAGFEHALQLAAERPELKLILSHMGGDSPVLVTEAARAARDLPNVFFGTESIREDWVIRKAIDLLGASRLLFGSDHNLNHPAPFLTLLRTLGLAKKDLDLILGGNAYALFGKRV